MTTTRRRPHRLARIALVSAVAIFSAGGCVSTYTINRELRQAAQDGDLASIEDILDRGADIDARDHYGWTALMAASGGGEVAVVELLLDRGADIEARDNDGYTALMAASLEGEVAAAELLLDRGADINAWADYGDTALMAASGDGQVAAMELLLDRGADIEARDDDGWTALMSAAGQSEVAAVELLLDRGADIEARNDYGWTALMWASRYGEVAAMELLLDRGADIDARTDGGETALMPASRYGEVAAVELLLDRGADIDARTDGGWTALAWASNYGHDEVAAVLRAWAAEPGGRQDTRPTLVQSQRPAPAAQAPRPGTPPPPPAEPAVEQNKTALLIANAAYDHIPQLTTPIQEARQLGAALKRIGFEVQMLTDGSQDEMIDALHRFEERVRERGGTALFHYGGHGIQVNGVNYLLPVDREIPDERRVRSRAIPVNEISGALHAARSTANIVILDACRNNPLPLRTRATDVRGLAPINDPPPNTIIVFAAASSQVAQDGLFTPTLLEHIEEPGIEITAMLRRVRRDVLDASGRTQTPTDYSQLVDDVYLAGGARQRMNLDR